MTEYFYLILPKLLYGLAIVIPLLLCVAYLTYAERRVIGLMQMRKGPNVVGPFGLLQPIADAIKVMTKETIIPDKAHKVPFIIAPIITFALSIVGWAVIPLSSQFVLSDINVGLLYIFAASSLGVYGIIISGWASQSKYAFLGAVRSSAQMISYELVIGMVILIVLACYGSLNLTTIVEFQRSKSFGMCALLAPMFIVFFIAALAETNRLPFDLPEAESELVAGYNVEYSSMSFAMFFLGEYANMILVCAMMTMLFWGGYLPIISYLDFIPGFIWFAFKISCLLFVFLWIRATLPRYRYDQLMGICWKFFLPLTLVWLLLALFLVRFGIV